MSGYIKVNVSTFGGLIPVKNAYVHIASEDGKITGSLLTDEDGNTSKICLPAEYADDESSKYAAVKYNVSVNADGYASCSERKVSVYGNIVSLVYFELIPEEMI